MTEPIACPLPWSAALRRNARAPRGELRARTLHWLEHHGWRPATRVLRELLLIDPLDLADRWFLDFAIRQQATRDAQRVLEPLGWELTGGGSRREDRVWTYAWGVCRRDRAGYFSLTQALKQERQVMPPALPRLYARPKLRVIRGGATG